MRTQHVSDIEVAPAVEVEPRSGRRLIVLVPGQIVDDAVLQDAVDRLARAQDLPVLFLGLSQDRDQELLLRPRLDRLTRAEASRARRQYRILRGRDWSQAIDAVRQENDVVVFPYRELPWARPTSDGAASVVLRRAPLALLALKASLLGLAGRLVDWGIPILIVTAFFFLQVRVLGLMPGGTGHDLLMALSVLAEIGLLWRWEQWSSQRLL